MAEVGTVARVLQLLSCFSEAEEWPLHALAARLDLPRSTTHRLLALCRAENFIDTDGKGAYRPGLALFRLSAHLGQNQPIRQMAAPLLARFTLAFNETSLLTLLDRRALKMFFAEKAAPATPMRYAVETNQLGPLAWGATGRSLLAYLTPNEQAAVIAGGEVSPAAGQPIDPAELAASLTEIRRTGYAITHGQRTVEGVGVAVPFFDAAGEVVGNVAVTVPDFRYTDVQGARFLTALQGIAAELSEALGSGRPAGHGTKQQEGPSA